MSKSNFKKADADYDGTTKTLYIKQPRIEFVPSYAYYCCEYLERKNKIEIDTVVFTMDDLREYRKEELKGKYEWSELDEQDRNSISNN